MKSLLLPQTVADIVTSCVVFFVLLSPGEAQIAKSQPNNASWLRPILAAPFCTVPPKVDGILDDPCWTTAARADHFARLTSPVVQQTEVWVCADKTHLYVAFHCYDSHPQLIHASETIRNGNTGVDDYVAVDLDSQNNRRYFSQFIVTARGTQNEYIEGGTADNITWAGDWRAVPHRTKDGWTAEMSIPFALLRYPRGAHTFGIQLERKLARETSISYWPDRPAVSQSNPIEYFASLTNIDPTFFPAQPIFLPYELASTGEGNSAKVGMDVKYPLSSGLTGLATINPDFGTVEQNVTNINFSYTQHYISDQRPFFVEGEGYYPNSDTFYSPKIAGVDEGLKVTGKENGTTVAVLATNQGGPNYQRVAVASFTHDLNPLSNLELDYAGNDQAGMQSGDVVKTQAALGWHVGQYVLNTMATHMFSWLGGMPAGGMQYYNVGLGGHPGHPSLNYNYEIVAPNLNTEIGFEAITNEKVSNYSFDQNNTFDKGYIQHYDVNASWEDTVHDSDSSFFNNSRTASVYANTHEGNGIYLGTSQSRWLEYRDHVNEMYFEWNTKSLYDSGNVDYQRGSQSDQSYIWYSANQGYGLSRNCSLSFLYNYQDLGGVITTQAVFTPTYRLTSERSIGGRIVNQSGKTDIYLTFAQKARAGADVYLIFGDPNSPTTRGLIDLKVVEPF
jgi:hypothetical protein